MYSRPACVTETSSLVRKEIKNSKLTIPVKLSTSGAGTRTCINLQSYRGMQMMCLSRVPSMLGKELDVEAVSSLMRAPQGTRARTPPRARKQSALHSAWLRHWIWLVTGANA